MTCKYGLHWLLCSIMNVYCHLEVMRPTPVVEVWERCAAEALRMLLEIDASLRLWRAGSGANIKRQRNSLEGVSGSCWRYSNDSGRYSTRPFGWMQYVNLSEAKSVP